MYICSIGSALTKHPVASQILTHNSERLAYTLFKKVISDQYTRKEKFLKMNIFMKLYSNSRIIFDFFKL